MSAAASTQDIRAKRMPRLRLYGLIFALRLGKTTLKTGNEMGVNTRTTFFVLGKKRAIWLHAY